MLEQFAFSTSRATNSYPPLRVEKKVRERNEAEKNQVSNEKETNKQKKELGGGTSTFLLPTLLPVSLLFTVWSVCEK